MTTKPILFSAPMIRALLDGRKTMTRRVLKGAPIGASGEGWSTDCDGEVLTVQSPGWGASGGRVIHEVNIAAPYAPGDLLWVREAWARAFELDEDDMPATAESTYFRADGEPFSSWDNGDGTYRDGIPWRPSIHMPRRYSRLTLRVTAVKVERLQDISEEDAMAEGIQSFPSDFGRGFAVYDREWINDEPGYLVQDAVASFRSLWNSINGPDAWDANPWVSAISFKVIHANIDQVTP